MSALKAGAASSSARPRASSKPRQRPARPAAAALTIPAGPPDCAPMNPLRSIAVAAAVLAACSKSGAPQGPAEVQVSTDLNPGMVDTALALVARQGQGGP